MQKILSRALILGSLVLLSACGIPGAVAYGVKAAQGDLDGAGDPGAGGAPAPRPAPTAADPDPAPMPMPAPRESIRVEQLPPVR